MLLRIVIHVNRPQVFHSDEDIISLVTNMYVTDHEYKSFMLNKGYFSYYICIKFIYMYVAVLPPLAYHTRPIKLPASDNDPQAAGR